MKMISGYQSERRAVGRRAAGAPRSASALTAPLGTHAHTPTHRAMSPKQFTREQVSNYNSKTDTILIIDNVVYDVSKFLDEHPGGHEVLVNQSGKDASEDFEDVGHSIDAKELMKKYVIGEVVAKDRVEREKRNFGWEADNKDQEPSFVNTWKFPVLLGIVVTIIYSYLFG